MRTKCNQWSWVGSWTGEEITVKGNVETISKTWPYIRWQYCSNIKFIDFYYCGGLCKRLPLFLGMHAEIIRGVIPATDLPMVQKNVYIHRERAHKCGQMFKISESGWGSIWELFKILLPLFCRFEFFRYQNTNSFSFFLFAKNILSIT